MHDLSSTNRDAGSISAMSGDLSSSQHGTDDTKTLRVFDDKVFRRKSWDRVNETSQHAADLLMKS